MVLKNKHDILVPLSLFFITIITRIPFTSKILSHWDSVSFALATERYDIKVHQPHPPGYFLYVMLGKFLNLFTHDPNMSFVIMSVIAGGLAVTVIYILAIRMYDRTTAWWSSVLAITNPVFWFYGEVALTYILEAFFSVFFAYLCWRILNGEHRLIFLSAIILALAGGVRQSTLVFLTPLWLYSIRKSPKTYVLISLALLTAGVLSWVLPMLSLTGDYAQYKAVIDEYWAFNFEPFTIVNTGFRGFFSYSTKFIWFITYGLSLCSPFIGVYMFKAGFEGTKQELLSKKGVFIIFWIIPYIVALLYVFMKAAIPGYFLLLMPALLMVSVKAVKAVIEKGYFSSKMFVIFMILTAIFNLYTFFFSSSPMSINTLKKNNVYVMDFMNTIRKNFSSTDAVILSPDYLFAGPRHFMYYLPEYRVYVMDERIDLCGRNKKVLWGQLHRTFVDDTAFIPRGIRYFVSPIHDKTVLIDIKRKGDKIITLYESGKNIAFYGDISIAPSIYRGVKFVIEE